ncbi:MAG: glutamine amidotransferase [Pirellulales bacterium]|nr:glutamine amidotransferase [Pirellulales bacterium]
MRLSLSPVGGYWLVALVACALVVLLWRVAPRAQTPFRRRVLTVLRVITVALVLLAMLRPTLVHTTTRRQSATLLVLADCSRSMSVADGLNNQSRWNTLRATLDESLPALRELAQDLQVKLFAFDAEARAVELADQLDLPAAPIGDQTALGAVLDDLLRRESGQRLAGVILLTDGAQRAYAPRDTAPQTVARRLADLGYPLHTVAFGQARGTGQTRDVSLADLAVNPTVFAKNQLVVAAAARLSGFANQDVPFELLFETAPGQMTRVADTSLRGDDAGDPEPVSLSYAPPVPGEYKLTLAAPPQPGELVTTNNTLSTFVTVTKGGLNVLYLEGALRPEQTFLTRSLDASDDIKCDYLRLDALERDSRPPDLAERFQPGRYDVYLLGDVAADIFTPAELASLAAAVRGGAGLIAIGGLYSFGGGGWDSTPLADLLPIEISPLDRQSPDEPVRADLHLTSPPQMLPTQIGERHFVMLLTDAAHNRAAWQALPPLRDGANRFRGLQPRAVVLAESAQGEPLLVARDIGAGRVLAFAGDSTWRWWMAGHADEHRRFWRQVMLWLAHKEDAHDAGAWVRLAQRRFAPGQRVEFTAGYKSESGNAAAVQLEAQVALPDGRNQPARLIKDSATWTGSVDEARAPGDYTLTVTAHDAAGNALGTAKARFLVFEQDLELDNPAADPQLLASLSAMTDGDSVPPEQFSSLLARLRNQPLDLEVATQSKVELWDNGPLLILIVGLWSLDWFLRKRWGLV